MADEVETELEKLANPFIEDLAEGVVRAIREQEARSLPFVQTYPNLGTHDTTTRQTLPSGVKWLLLYSPVNAAPDLTLTVQGLPLPVTVFPAQIQLPIWGGQVEIVNSDATNDVTVIGSDRAILPSLVAGGSSTAPVYAELTGSLAPLNPLPPVLVATVPYSSLTASSAFFVEVTTLHANARERAWTVNNTLNEPLSGLKFAPFDTASNALSTATTLNAQEESSPTPPGSGNYVLYESRNIPILGTATDSMRVELDMGATAPTSGNVYVVVREVL